MDINLQDIAIISGESRITFNEMLLRSKHYSTFLQSGKDSRVVIFGENRVGWIYAFFSVWMKGCIATPVDAGSTVHDVAYILKDCTPQYVWSTHKSEETIRKAISEAGIETTLFFMDDKEDVPVEGQYTDPFPWRRIDEEGNQDTALIIYTSGTTGMPKGVMLSYDNLRMNVAAVSHSVKIFHPKRRTMILLPLHHILPLLGSLVAPMYVGGGVAICPSLSGPDLMDTMVRGKVSIVIGVPRLYQSLYAGIKKKIDSSLVTRMLFNLCQSVGSRSLSRLVFGSIRNKMGGRIDYFVCGGAALDLEVGRGLRTLGLDVLEGFGMTEAAPMISFTRPYDIRPGCAGRPLPGVEIKIVDGELLARGANIMKGYYNRPEETAQVIDKDGFLHTGDLATIGPEGHVTITGRCKEIIVLSNGKNVQPNEIEYKLEKFDAYVREAAVVQDGDLLRAIIAPNREWAESLTDAEVEKALKREVLEPYNMTVSNYKKLMSLMVYRGDLPRTKMEKLQRFKLKDILDGAVISNAADDDEPECDMKEYQIIKEFIQAEKRIKVRPTSHLETDLAMDSLDKIGLQGFMEKTFGVSVKAEAMASFDNVLQLAQFVADRKTHIDIEELDWHSLLNSESGHLDLPKASFLSIIGIKCFRPFFAVWNRLKVVGLENVPEHGPYIIAPNHQSFVDAPVVMSPLKTNNLREIYTYATEDHVRGGFRRYLARHNNVIIMERANLRDSILKMAEVLKRGKSILIFPEGSRTHDGDLETYKRTFAILSIELGVPVVPVRIKGAYQAWSRYDRFLKPYRIEVEYFPPVMPKEGMDYDDLAESIRDMVQ